MLRRYRYTFRKDGDVAIAIATLLAKTKFIVALLAKTGVVVTLLAKTVS